MDWLPNLLDFRYGTLRTGGATAKRLDVVSIPHSTGICVAFRIPSTQHRKAGNADGFRNQALPIGQSPFLPDSFPLHSSGDSWWGYL